MGVDDGEGNAGLVCRVAGARRPNSGTAAGILICALDRCLSTPAGLYVLLERNGAWIRPGHTF